MAPRKTTSSARHVKTEASLANVVQGINRQGPGSWCFTGKNSHLWSVNTLIAKDVGQSVSAKKSTLSNSPCVPEIKIDQDRSLITKASKRPVVLLNSTPTIPQSLKLLFYRHPWKVARNFGVP